MTVIETSALLAVVLEEPVGAAVFQGLAHSIDPVMSAVTLYEASVGLMAQRGPAGVARLNELIAVFGIRIVPFEEFDAQQAAQAYGRFGKGFHPAGLNLGDCPAYVLAKKLGAPLLFVGDDFARTDVMPVF